MKTYGNIPQFRRRYPVVLAIVVVAFVVLIGRLWQLQIAQRDFYREQTTRTFIQEIRVRPIRGKVFDRLHRPLISNRPGFDIYVTPRFVDERVLTTLLEQLALDPARVKIVRDKIREPQGKQRWNPRLILKDIDRDQLARLETHSSDLPGVRVVPMVHRQYVHGNLAAHLLGYLSEVTYEELQNDDDQRYQAGDLVGRYGVERMLETHLRGYPGKIRMVVDAHGRRKRDRWAMELLNGPDTIKARAGHNVVLTIDLELQRDVEQILRRFQSSAAVLVDINDGRILASASKPSVDPNLLSGRLSGKEMQELIGDSNRPLLDKVYRENYFPGSIFKVVTAIAALSDGVVDWNEKILCKRYYQFGGRNFKCSHSHGNIDLRQALIESCNIYFYTLAERVGMDRIAEYAHQLGLGAATGVGINGEVSGVIPVKAWYGRRGMPFRVGYTLNSAIGQGNTKVTLIQMAMLYTAIANGGRLWLPQLIERIETSDGALIQGFQPRLRREVKFDPNTLRGLQQALRGVVQDTKGTAYLTRDKAMLRVDMAGKTGTAQASHQVSGGKTIWMDDHAWFAGYTPADQPEVAFVVLVEHGGSAAKVAVPAAAEIAQVYLEYAQHKKAQQEKMAKVAGVTR